MDFRDQTKIKFNSLMSTQLSGCKVAIIYDDPNHISPLDEFSFPADYKAEWESQNTIEKISHTWEILNVQVVLIPLDKNFFQSWQAHLSSISFVHSLVEGWGSVSRESWIPALCEMSGVPCIGSSPLAHCISMRKSLLKKLCHNIGIPTAPFYLIRSMADFNDLPSAFIGQQLFIKPDCEGSGMGISRELSICLNHNETKSKVEHLLKHYPEGIILEEYLTGREYTTALIGSPPKHLPVAEVEVDGGVYGLAQKSKTKMEERVSFPKLPKKTEENLKDWSQYLFLNLEMADMVRIDWKENSQGEPCFLEANTLPGLSYYYSVLPKMAEAAGIDYSTLLALLGNSALQRKNQRNYQYGRSIFNGM